MKQALITGANKSIGLETARQLLLQGYYVYLGSRDLSNGQQAADHLRAEGLTQVEAVQLDVADSTSVAAARAAVGQRTAVLDVLINNAGISGGFPQSPRTFSVDEIQQVFDINVFGVIRVTQAFLDLLEQSVAPRIVNVTSGLASLTLHHNPSWAYYPFTSAAYIPSKVALNAYTVMLAKELHATAFKVNAVDPGYTATDFNQHRGHGTVQEAARRILAYTLLAADGPTGQFISEQTNPETGEIPW